jgi:HEAT repeat protein
MFDEYRYILEKDIIDVLKYFSDTNLEEYFPLLKDIFFHPLTDNDIRMEVGKVIASTKNKQVYYLLISHLILKNFSDLPSLVFTLGEYAYPELFEILEREYNNSNFNTKIQIINALAKIKSDKAIEFFSKIFNDEIKSPNLNNEQILKLKEAAGEALQKKVIDF